MGLKQHRANAPRKVSVAIITVSTTRSLDEDGSGAWIRKRVAKEGHQVVFHQVVKDIADHITGMVCHVLETFNPDVILINGGTGISKSDVTVEAVKRLFNKELTSFATLFAMLSFEEINSAAMLSRAVAGVTGDTVIFSMPGSLKACKLACRELIFPELGHLVGHIHQE